MVWVRSSPLAPLRALAYARATRPSCCEALLVDVDEAETLRLKEEWDGAAIPVPVTVLASTSREITRPVVRYVKQLRRESPRDIVTVFIPEYVLGHWWEQVLHNQSALRLKARLLQLRGVVVASVPYQLKSAVERTPGWVPSQTGPPQAGPPQASPSQASPPQAGPPRQARPQPGEAAGAEGRRRPASQSKTTALHRLTAGREDLHAEELQAEIDQISAKPVGDCTDREVVDVAGTLRTVTLRPRGPSLTMEADLWDGTGDITLVWPGRRAIPGIRPGRRITVHGRIARIKDERTIYNPSYQLKPGPD